MPVILLGITVIFVLVATMVVLVFFMRKQITQEMRLAQEQILQTARQQMELAQAGGLQLELRKQAIEHTVAGLKEELGKYQQMLRESEGDRARKFGSLENELKNASSATHEAAGNHRQIK